MEESLREPLVESPEALRWSFTLFAILFSFNHGAVTTPIVYASTMLQPEIAYAGNACLYAGTIISTLVLGAQAVIFFGLKPTLLCGMGLYTFYAVLFAVACGAEHEMQRNLFLAGSWVGGVGAGLLWTAQGVYFAYIAREIAARGTSTAEAETALLSGRFAAIYLAGEVFGKVTAASLSGTTWPWAFAAAAFVSLGGVMVVVKPADPPVGRPCEKIKAIFELMGRPKLWLLAGTNCTFGFAGAYMNGYVNGQLVAPVLGHQSIGALSASTAATAGLTGYVCGKAGPGRKGLLVALGAACFGAVALTTVLVHDLQAWGWYVVLFYVVGGVGRGVYESTNKAVFADAFPDNAPGAFASCMLQASVASALGFVLSGTLGHNLAWLVVGCAVLTPMAYAVAAALP